MTTQVRLTAAHITANSSTDGAADTSIDCDTDTTFAAVGGTSDTYSTSVTDSLIIFAHTTAAKAVVAAVCSLWALSNH